MRLAFLKHSVIRVFRSCHFLVKDPVRPYSELDLHIAPLVVRMNRHGDILTVA